MTTNSKTVQGRAGPLRVDLIDDRHADWPAVLAALSRKDRRSLMLDGNWLSSRQSLLVARAGDQVAGHLSFHIKPQKVSTKKVPCVEAELDALDVRPGFCESEVKELLVEAAIERATLLRCHKLVGFEFGKKVR